MANPFKVLSDIKSKHLAYFGSIRTSECALVTEKGIGMRFGDTGGEEMGFVETPLEKELTTIGSI